MQASMHIANSKCKENVCIKGNDKYLRIIHTANMAAENRNHLRAWREKAGMTQEELADEVETTKAVISQLENEHRALSPKWLRRLAPVLGTQPGHILDVDPNEVDSDIIDIWGRISDLDKPQAIKTLQSFIRTGTDD